MDELDDSTRKAIKRDIETLGIEISEREIDETASKIAQQREYEAERAELLKHLALQHYTMSGLYLLGLDSLNEIHLNAPKQGNHAE